MTTDEKEEVRELLGRAVAGVPVPAGSGSDTVFARAARLRRRRRAAVGGAVAAVLAGGAVLGYGKLPQEREAPVASAPTGGGAVTDADSFTELLPDGVGEVTEVSLMRLIKQVPDEPLPADVGPYDGDYAVERAGGVGYLAVHAYGAKQARWKGSAEDPCALAGNEPEMTECTTEQLPGGARLSIWRWAGNTDGQPRWGPELTASLRLADGTVRRLRDTTGDLGQGSQGPLLKSPPMTRDQLRALALRPELLP
jgi:hypothetical protein